MPTGSQSINHHRKELLEGHKEIDKTIQELHHVGTVPLTDPSVVSKKARWLLKNGQYRELKEVISPYSCSYA